MTKKIIYLPVSFLTGIPLVLLLLITGMAVLVILPAPEVFVEDLEIVQSIQELGHSMPLIAGKPTVVRAYIARGYFGSLPSLLVTGELQLTLPDGSSQTLTSLNQVDVVRSDTLRAKRDSIEKSLNFMLPVAWVQAGNLTVKISSVLDAPGSSITCNDCTTHSRWVTLLASPSLHIRLLGLRFKEENQTVQEPLPRPTDYALVKSWLVRAYPVAPNDLQIEQGELLAELTSSAYANYTSSTNKCGSYWFSALAIAKYLDGGPIFVPPGFVSAPPQYLTSGLAYDPFAHYLALKSDGDDGAGNRPYFSRGCGEQGDPASGTEWLAGAPTGPTGLQQAPWSIPNSTGTYDYWDYDASPTTPSNDNLKAYGDWYAGHELAHNFGRHHVFGRESIPGACGDPQAPYDLLFPFLPAGTISLDNNANPYYVGLDIGDSNPGLPTVGASTPSIPMAALPGNGWHDIMTYCIRQWVSPYTYQGIYARLLSDQVPCSNTSTTAPVSDAPTGVPPTSSPPVQIPEASSFVLMAEKTLARPQVETGDLVHIMASVNLTKKTGEFVFVSRTSHGLKQAVGEKPHVQIRIWARDGAEIGLHDVHVIPSSRSTDSQDLVGRVSALVPFSPKLASIELLWSGQVIDRLVVSKHPPTLSKLVPVNPEDGVSGKNPLIFRWKGNDDDSLSALKYYAQLSPDKGKTWRTIAIGLSRPELAISPEQLKGFSSVTVKVIGHDGFHSAVLISNPIELLSPTSRSSRKRL